MDWIDCMEWMDWMDWMAGDDEAIGFDGVIGLDWTRWMHSIVLMDLTHLIVGGMGSVVFVLWC